MASPEYNICSRNIQTEHGCLVFIYLGKDTYILYTYLHMHIYVTTILKSGNKFKRKQVRGTRKGKGEIIYLYSNLKKIIVKI